MKTNNYLMNNAALIIVQRKVCMSTVYAIYFVYRYFCDFGLGGEIRDGLILQFLWCFHYYK